MKEAVQGKCTPDETTQESVMKKSLKIIKVQRRAVK